MGAQDPMGLSGIVKCPVGAEERRHGTVGDPRPGQACRSRRVDNAGGILRMWISLRQRHFRFTRQVGRIEVDECRIGRKVLCGQFAVVSVTSNTRARQSVSRCLTRSAG